MAEDLSVLTRATAPPDATLRYGPLPDQVADLRCAKQARSLPLLVLIHGGFWKPEYDRSHLQPMSCSLAAAGWTVLTLEYRRVPGDPDVTLHDVARAIGTLPQRVGRHDRRIVLVGHSAGGHLALWAAAACTLPALHGVLALAPVAGLQHAEHLQLGDNAVRRFLGRAAAQRPDADPMQLPAPAVAVTVVHGEEDEVVPMTLARAYGAAFPGTRLVPLPGAGHFPVIDPLSTVWPVVEGELRRLSGPTLGS